MRQSTEKKLHRYICEGCGNIIFSVGKKRIIKCERCLKKERSKKYRVQTNSPYVKRKPGNMDIHADIRELVEYNEEHGTNYSYGQYKLQNFLGKL